MTETKPLISVIIPAYNVEKYLYKCMESVAAQTFTDFEVLLVDDGSTDTTPALCDQCGEKYPFVRVFHKTNGGLSDARNYGIERSYGEYLTFIDSDDYITEDYLQYLYDLLKETENCRMSICSIYNLFTANQKTVNNGNGVREMLSGKTCIERMCYHDQVDTCAYAKLYHRSLFDTVCYPKGKVFEDIGTTYKMFLQCDQVACGFEPKYYYVIRQNSITTAGFSTRKLDLLEMTDQMAADVVKVYPDLAQAVRRRQAYARFSTLNQMLEVTEPEHLRQRKQIVDYLNTHRNEILADPRTPKRDKIAYYVLKLGFPLYRVFWKTYVKIRKG